MPAKPPAPKATPPAPLERPRPDPKRASADLIYDSVMRCGGEPFGAPFEAGLSSLTERIVKLFKLSGFFGFESMERLRAKNRRNKFTRHGAAPFLGEHGTGRRK